MKYLYNGVVVESDRVLDSAVFVPITGTPAEKPTEPETAIKKPAKKSTKKA